ncbi:hypothetical protein [Streptomyces sp. NPDC048606]|uniref:hypothetical protein n=1 Tax=Streptomyces sp. NPDC048606 TaxID=3154726 RepID=UPI0034192E09
MPATPVYTIVITASGVYIDGDRIIGPTGDLPAARRAALTDIRVRAALRGRPVRVTAREPDGTSWPLIVDADGNLTTLPEPHPTPPQPAQPPPPAPAPPPRPPTVAWGTPLPTHHLDTWTQLRTAHAAGDTSTATVLAKRLETTLESEYGPLHPYTVGALSALAWQAGNQQNPDDPIGTVTLLIRVALRRGSAGAEPKAETDHIIRSAHEAWHALAAEDSEAAIELSTPLVDMLTRFGQESRTHDVVRWVEEAVSGPG